MNEYWLQKKTIGGWSHVTWYDNIDQAKVNFDRASNGNSGYSWRLVKVEMIEKKLLEEAIPIEPPAVELAQVATPMATGWDKPMAVHLPVVATPSSSQARHGLAGKIWMVNRQTGHKTRIDPVEQQAFEANGYQKGGPRS